MMANTKIVVCITGASGAIYGIRFLEALKKMGVESYLVISKNAKLVISQETGYGIDEVLSTASHHYDNSDFCSPIASGSNKFYGCVIVPCSCNTLSKIALGVEDNLISRVGGVCVKEGRRLVLVPREAPLSRTILKRMYELSSSGVSILPACPAFYAKPTNIEHLVNFITGRIFDVLDIEYEYKRWSGI